MASNWTYRLARAKKPPVSAKTIVQVQGFNTGEDFTGRADSVAWAREPWCWRIKRYRVVSDAEAEMYVAAHETTQHAKGK